MIPASGTQNSFFFTFHVKKLLKFCYVILISVLFREACNNFLELIKQKNEDRLWIDEIAAMQAHSRPELPYLRTSGIILAGEDNDAGGKQNGFVDASVSESTPSHASLDINQGIFSVLLPNCVHNQCKISLVSVSLLHSQTKKNF